MSEGWIRELIQLIGAPKLLLENIRAAQELKYRHFPASLYKYRKVDKYSLDNLESSTLHLNFASSFNDPYDSAMKFDPLFGLTYPELLLKNVNHLTFDQRNRIISADDPISELVNAIYSELDEPYDKQEAKTLVRVIKERESTLIEQQIVPINSFIQNSYKICSLSKRLDSLPLWAHYGDNHRGFAMEYDFSSLLFDDLIGLLLWPVIYTGVFDASALLQGVGEKKEFNNLAALIAALHKSPDWKYEEEWRVVLIDGYNEPPRNMPAPLKTVFLGAKIPEEEEVKVIQAARKADVPVFKMRLVPHEFRMEAVPYSEI